MSRKRAAEEGRVVLDDVDALTAGMEHLRLADNRLAPLIESFGPPERLLAKDTSCFRSLAKSIIYQQLAGSAAAAIYSRFLAACGVPDETHLTPTAVLATPLPALRGCGLSERKASYIADLAAHFADGRLSDELLTSASDAELLQHLTAVRGIGPWTVHMFAMFHLGHPNILPVGDLAVRKGLAHLCGLKHLPSPAEMEELTAAWQPYRSLGSFYMWRIPLPPQASRRSSSSSSKPANSKAKGKAGSTGQQRKAKAVPAAVSPFVDVGVDPAAPMQAMTAPGLLQPGTVGGNEASGLAAAAAAAATDVPLLPTPVKPIHTASSTAMRQAPAAAAGSADSGPQGNSQQVVAGGSAAAAAAATAATAAAAAAAGVMTRRRLRWAQQAAAAAAAAGPGVGGGHVAGSAKGYKERVVDL